MRGDKGRTVHDIEAVAIRSRESFEACLDYVRNEVKCSGVFAEISKEDAKRLIETLVNEGKSPGVILKKFIASSQANYLFSVLYDKVCGNREKRKKLLDALVSASKNWYVSDVLDAKSVAKKYSSAEDFQHLLDYHSHELLHERDKSWLMGYFSADEYWLWKVRWYIAKKDHLRAWDEFRKAQKGFFIGRKKAGNPPDEVEINEYCCNVSDEACSMLVRELYVGMRAAGLLPDAVDECSMMLLMAEHFRREKNARRRENNKKKVDRISRSEKQ